MKVEDFEKRIQAAADDFNGCLVELRAEIETKRTELARLESLLVDVESQQRSASLRAAAARRRRVLGAEENAGPLALVRDGEKH